MDRSYIKKTLGDRILDICVYTFLILLVIITFYPMWYVFVASLSDSALLMQEGAMLLWPVGFTTDAYRIVLSDESIRLGFRNSIFYTVVGTTISMILTIHLSYALSRKWLYGRRFFNIFITIPMFFVASMIPSFLVIKGLGLYDTIWAILLPTAISIWNVIMMKTYFLTISSELEESAKIDGANDFQILYKIIIPCSKPIIAVILLFYAVGIWNSWFNASIYLQNENLAPLQLVMRDILIQGDTSGMMQGEGGSTQQISKSLKYATVIVSTIPILIIYPFVQKYFVKGIMLGSVKE